MFGRVGANEAAVIIDYGQKVEPTGQIESQSECFGKAGISQFGATFLMPASSFEKTKLEEMLGEDRTKSIKPSAQCYGMCRDGSKGRGATWVQGVMCNT